LSGKTSANGTMLREIIGSPGAMGKRQPVSAHD
jgi:hypothetical protein